MFAFAPNDCSTIQISMKHFITVTEFCTIVPHEFIILFFGKRQVRQIVVSAERVADTCLFVCDMLFQFRKKSLLSDTVYPIGGIFANARRTLGLCYVILFFCCKQQFLLNPTRLPPTVQSTMPCGCSLRFAETSYRCLLYRCPLPVSSYHHLQLLSR